MREEGGEEGGSGIHIVMLYQVLPDLLNKVCTGPVCGQYNQNGHRVRE